MKKILNYKIYVSQEIDKPLVYINPVFSFFCPFDSDVESSFNEVCDLDDRVKRLYNVLCELGCKCSVHREEFTNLFDNSINFDNDNKK